MTVPTLKVIPCVLVCHRLADLESSFKDGDVTAKGYVKCKANLLRGELPSEALEEIQDLELKFCNGDISEARVGATRFHN